MYHSPLALSAGTAVGGVALLPRTGFDVVWFVLAAFALIGAGTALLRVLPRRSA
jgi:LPXTG-motif cell wall-anchored protein